MPAEIRERSVILVGWDGADWGIARPLMEAGRMPVLSRLLERGTHGDIASYAPYLSPMLWTTVATGKHPQKHGVHGFAELRNGRVMPVSSHTRRAEAFWNILSRNGISCGTVGWYASHPAEPIHGFAVSDAFLVPPIPGKDWPVPEGAVHPITAAEDLAETRVRVDDIDPGLLGLFIPDVASIDLTKDTRPRRLLERLAELYTAHNTAVQLAGQVRCLAAYYHFLDWVSHDFMEYTAPQRPEISSRDFSLYRHVVDGAYQLQDLLLGDLLQTAEPDATVIIVSDHGFHSGDSRPVQTPRVAAGIAAWHRPTGIFAAAGPGIANGGEPAHARLADVTPTLLALYGIPAGEDMDGRVLAEILTETPPLPIPSWETGPAEPPSEAMPGAELLLERFVELGYLAKAGQGGDEITRQNQWALGIALMELDHPLEALSPLENCYLGEPESIQYAYHVARCRLQLGLLPEAREALETLEDMGTDQPLAVLMRARILLAELRPEEAWKALMQADHLTDGHADERDRLKWRILLQQGSFAEVEEEITRILEKRPAEPEDLLPLAHAKICLGKFEEAVAAARGILGTGVSSPSAFSVLAQALEQLARPQEALTVYRQWLMVQPMAEFPKQRIVALSKNPPRPLPKKLGPEIHRKITAERVAIRDQARSEGSARATGAIAHRTAQREGKAQVESMCIRSGRKISADHFIVSGVPRSGTSLMMRMLAMGGLPVLTDGARPADEDNPMGYFEWAPVKQLPEQPGLMSLAEGKVVKVFSGLLKSLPSERRYRVIFMRRPSVEAVRSQDVMLARSGSAHSSSPDIMVDELDRHVAETLSWAAVSDHIELLEIPFRGLFDDPELWCARIETFIGPDRIKRPGSMMRAIRPELYRQRQQEGTA